MTMLVLLSLLSLLGVQHTNQLAQPKGFTDDPYVDDDKFIEKGDWKYLVSYIIRYLLNQMKESGAFRCIRPFGCFKFQYFNYYP